MVTINQRITQLEQRRASAEPWPELIILNKGEEMTAHQKSECERAARNGLPTLTIIIEGARHGE
ncbi:MAG: hypothetical protein Q8O64_12870 [Sideroxyarcus sp.]|nr:hypothetical protein [Sideroxyarcus sp.]